MSDLQGFDNPFVLQASVVEKEDVDQEMALLKLQGITASRHIVMMKLMQKSEALFQGDPGAIAQPIISRTLPPSEVVQMLINWAVHQNQEISRAVLDFLEEPNDDELETLVSLLQSAGLARKVKPSSNGRLSDTLTAYLLKKPSTKEELYEYTRTIHQATRPEAAVRQYLRRAVSNGLLVEIDCRYWVAKNMKG